MMQVESLAEQLFFTTVRVDVITKDRKEGSGTAFFFSYKKGDVNYPFIVTNKHVVMEMLDGKLSFLERQDETPKIGKGFSLRIEGWPSVWFGHPSPEIDIAVCAFAPLETHIKQEYGVDIFYRYISDEMIPTSNQIASLDAIESITFIGYPNGIWDSKNLLPVARKGTTASPISIDFENTACFLIDASVFGGSSGSPVFILNQGMFTDKKGVTQLGSRLLFVGVIASVFFRTELNNIVAVPVPTQMRPMSEQKEMIDLGVVFKASTVVETVEAFLKAKNIA